MRELSTGQFLRRGVATAVVVLLALAVWSGWAAGLSIGRGGGAVGETTAADDPRPVVLTTFTVLADIARNVAGDHLRVESLTKPGAEIHGYEPTPGDLRRAASASLIVDNGLGLEAWFAKFVSGIDVPHVVLSRDVTPIPVTSGGHVGAPNPHAWMSPVVVQSYVDVLVEAFTALDPAHAADYRAQGAAYRDRLGALQTDVAAQLATVPEARRVLVSCEGAFSYLVRDTGLREAYLWPVNAESQATPRRVASVIDAVRATGVPAVFCESTVNAAAMRAVVASTDASFGGTLYVDSLSAAGGPVPTYLDLIRHDTDLVVAGLTGRADGPS